MFDKLLSTAAANAKLVLAATAGAALVAGGSAVALTNVADSGTAPSAASGQDAEHASDQGLGSRSDTATVGIAPRPPHAPKVDNQHPDNHGGCVSLVAKAAPDANAQPGDHGKLVSQAAKTCAKPGDAATSDKAKAQTKGKSADAKSKTHPTGTADSTDQAETPDAPDATDSSGDSGTDSSGPSSNGTTHSGGRAGGH